MPASHVELKGINAQLYRTQGRNSHRSPSSVRLSCSPVPVVRVADTSHREARPGFTQTTPARNSSVAHATCGSCRSGGRHLSRLRTSLAQYLLTFFSPVRAVGGLGVLRLSSGGMEQRFVRRPTYIHVVVLCLGVGESSLSRDSIECVVCRVRRAPARARARSRLWIEAEDCT